MSKLWLRVVLLVCLCALETRHAWALDPTSRISQYGHTAWRSSEGYFDSEPYALAQSKDGYLWIGSASGLARFDGVRFVKFTTANGVKLPSSAVYSLLTDRDGSLWIGTAQGLSHLKDSVLTNLASSNAGVRGIAQDDGGTVWVARANMRTPGGALCRAEGTKLQCFGPAQGFPLPFAKTIACDHEGNVWVGGATSYIRWSPTSQTVYSPPAFKNNMDLAAIGSTALAPDGHPLIGMTRMGPGLGLEEMIDGKPRPFGPFEGFDAQTQGNVNVIRVDSRGAVWLGTEEGVIRLYNGIADRFTLADGLSGQGVQDIVEDREGDIWLATGDGIDRLRDLPVKSFNQRNGMRMDATHSLLADRDGALWIQDGVGLSVLEPGVSSTFRHDKTLDGKGFIRVMFQARDGSLWMSPREDLVRYNHGKLQTIARPKDAPPHTSTYAFAEEENGDILALQSLAPDLWRVHDGVATRVITTPALPPAYTMALDHRGVLWIAIVGGKLGRLEGTNLQVLSVQHSETPSLLRQLTVTQDNTVLGAGDGLVVYKDGQTSILGKASGLPCERIISFTFDLTENLWMTSTCGTFEISREDWRKWRSDPKTQVKPLVFDALDGVRYTAISLNHAADTTHDGRLWFATGAVLQMIDPRNLTLNRVVPAVHIENVTADGVQVDANSSPHLPALTRQLQIDYTATSLSLPQRVLFRYKLEGYDRGWQTAGTRRQAFYNDLRPGTYRFTVLACNNSGIWNETGSSTSFTIAPAWFQTRWFMAACFLLAVLTLYALYRLRVTQLRKRLQLQYTTRLEERTRVARDLHDTLLQTIQGTKLVAEEALHGSDDPTQLHNVVAKIHEWLSRAVIEGRAALTALRTGSNAGDLAEKLRVAAEGCAQSSLMEVRFETVGAPIELSSDMTEEIFRIGYEAIRNACAHSQGSILDVQLTYGKMLKLAVKDNGIGFEFHGVPNRASGHYGLDGMRERAKQLGGSLAVASAPGNGTEIILTTKTAR